MAQLTNKRLLEVFRDMQILKKALQKLEATPDESVSFIARDALLETRPSFEWQNRFDEESFNEKD